MAFFETVELPIDSLSEDPANVRKHSEKNFRTVYASLKAYGPRQAAVVDADNIIRAGNLRIAVARRLRDEGFVYIERDATGKETGRRHDFATYPCHRALLSKTELIAYGIVDNRSAELGEWELQGLGAQLSGLLSDGVDLTSLGFDPHEFNPLIEGDFTPSEPDSSDGAERSREVRFSVEEWAVIMEARAALDEQDLTHSEAITSICRRFLASR